VFSASETNDDRIVVLKASVPGTRRASWHARGIEQNVGLDASRISGFMRGSPLGVTPDVQALLDALGDSVALLDRDGVVVAVNAAWRAFARDAGGAAPEHAHVGWNYLTVCERAEGQDEREASRVAAGIRDVLSGRRERFESEYECPTPDTTLWFGLRVAPLELGGRRHALVIHRETTESVRARLTLTEAQHEAKKLALVAARTENAVIITDASGRIEWVNDGFTRITGYAAAEVMGRRPGTILQGPGTEDACRLRMQAAVRAGRAFKEEVLNYAKSGKPYWLSIDCQPVYDARGRLTNFVAIETDITERKEAEEALRSSEERFRLLVQSAPAAICVTQGGRFVYTNRAAVRLFGAEHERDLLGRDVLDTASPESRGTVLEREREVLELGAMPALIEESRVGIDGRSLDVEIARTPCMHDGAPAVQSVFHDLSQRRRLEEELRQAQKMEAVGQFASGLAHDFNNLLTAIFGHLALAKGRVGAGHPAGEPLAMIEEAARQAGTITKALLTFGRKTFAQKRTTDLNELARRTADLIGPVLPSTVRVAAPPPEAPPAWVVADPTQIQHVLMNLALNARDAMPAGGVLSLAVRRGVAQDGPGRPMAALEVTDTGVGMSADVVKRIFEPFYTTKPRGQGTGLGLPIVHGIVRDHGGTVDVRSRAGEGSTFTVWLPESAPPSGHDARHAATRRRPAGELILLIDPHRHVRRIVASSLAGMGFRVAQAGSVPEARASVLNPADPPRVVVADLDGGSDEPRVPVEELATLPGGVPVVMLSGGPAAPDLAGLSRTPTELLLKPVQMTDLAWAVLSMLDRAADAQTERTEP
jgi:PAS domain S-box-containing protein